MCAITAVYRSSQLYIIYNVTNNSKTSLLIIQKQQQQQINTVKQV